MSIDGHSPTLGEQRVRVSFNPSSDNKVDQIKAKSAELIDICQELKMSDQGGAPSEQARLAALAQTAYEEAAMWAVKAATMGK